MRRERSALVAAVRHVTVRVVFVLVAFTPPPPDSHQHASHCPVLTRVAAAFNCLLFQSLLCVGGPLWWGCHCAWVGPPPLSLMPLHAIPTLHAALHAVHSSYAPFPCLPRLLVCPLTGSASTFSDAASHRKLPPLEQVATEAQRSILALVRYKLKAMPCPVGCCCCWDAC